ncbi:hypothetical protein [Vibrio lentus]|uniref:hypothetical protein n=1 Tax=Vibrio lentus TaxID=136468 RepID=UPI00178C8941|nr:hypothetical protein [Vibrio lentus]MDN3632437.1 hypothetical protein [Vibrio lentus]
MTILYAILLFLCGFLPNGLIFGIPLMKIVLLLAVLTIAIRFFIYRERLNANVVLMTLFILIVMLFSYLKGISFNQEQASFQFNNILMFVVFYFCLFSIVRSNAGYNSSWIFRGYFLLIAFKLVFFSFIFFDFVSIKEFQDFSVKFFGVEPIMMIISDGMVRIQYQVDILIIPSMYFVWCRLREKIGMAQVMMALMLVVNICITYSKFYFIFALFFVFVAFCFTSVRGAGICFSLVFLFLFLFSGEVEGFLYNRFFSPENSYSDAVRYEQFSYLLDHVAINPLFGQGLGYYISNYLRSNVEMYSYEIQWLSLIMQVGFVGIVVFVFFILSGLVSNVRLKFTKNSLLWAFAVFFLMLVSFTNPMLTTPAMAASLYSFKVVTDGKKC